MSTTYQSVELDRECLATLIPGGQAIALHAGETVLVTQTLGDSVTVQTEHGYLVRLNPVDSAALGLTDAVSPAPTAAERGRPFDLDDVVAALKNVFDPEIPINVVDLGLIYRCPTARTASRSICP